MIKTVWKKRIRRQLRIMRLPDFQLGHDPLEYLAFHRELGSVIATLCQELRDGSYRARHPEFVRSAKGGGLTRPIAYLPLRDLLLYKTIVSLAENALLASSKPWTRFGRMDVDDKKDGGDSLSASGWFNDWLKRQGQVWTITENHNWLIETDVANFFPYVNVASVLRHVLANSNLDEHVARLLEHMLRRFSPMNEYRVSPLVGLPQEHFDCSRILAHTYLNPVDSEFEIEGKARQYSRWMDDIVIGAATRDEALRKVARAQTSLERLGLYPNTAKTRIIRADRFTEDYMKDENDYLGEVEERLESGAAENMAKFRGRVKQHVRRRDPKPKAWSQVLKRYYTSSRSLRDKTLQALSYDHIRQHPTSARHVFEYLSTFQLTTARHRRLVAALSQLGGVYQDVEILAHEYVCMAPNVSSAALRTQVVRWALEVLDQNRERDPRLAAAACMTVGKFGFESDIRELRRRFRDGRWPDNAARQQALVVLIGASLLSEAELSEITPISTSESAQHIRFLRRLIIGDADVVNMTLNSLQPVQRKRPNRYVLRPRILFLAPVVAKSAPAKRNAAASRWARVLKGNRLQLRDFAAEHWLGV